MAIASTLKDRVLAADPGLIRLLLAVRATGAVGATLLILLAVQRLVHYPVTVPLLGAALGMTWSIAVNDREPRAQRITTLALWLPAAASLTLGTATGFNRVLQDAVFLIVLFASVYIRKYGPRGFAIGMMCVLTFFFALFLRATFQQLPWLLFALAVTTICAYAVRFFIFRDNSRRSLANAASAFRARQRLIAATIAQAHECGHWTAAMKRRVNHHLLRLNEAAIVMDDILSVMNDAEGRAAVLDAELQTSEIVERAMHDPGANEDVPPLDLAAGHARDDRWTPRGAFKAGTAIDTKTLSPSARQALQITAAAIVSIVAGELLSPQRWYWAVLTAFVVFTGTSSSGETLSKAWSRFLGTAVGVVGGIAFGTLVRGDRTAAVSLLFVFLFAAVYAMRLSYGFMILFFTGVLSMLYILIGSFSDTVLILRLLETALGAACGGIAALLIFPIRTRDVVGSVAAEALQRLDEVVDRSVDRLAGDSSADPISAVRAYDEALQTIRAQLTPMISAARIAGNEKLSARLVLFGACGHYARGLAALAYDGSATVPLEDLQSRRAQIDEDIRKTIDVLEGRARTFEDGAGAAALQSCEPLEYLCRIDRTIRHLGKTLERS